MYELFYSFIKKTIEEDPASNLIENSAKTPDDSSNINDINVKQPFYENKEKFNYSFPKQRYGKVYIPNASAANKRVR